MLTFPLLLLVYLVSAKSSKTPVQFLPNQNEKLALFWELKHEALSRRLADSMEMAYLSHKAVSTFITVTLTYSQSSLIQQTNQ